MNKKITVEQIILLKESLNENYDLLVSKGYTHKKHFPYDEKFLLKKLEYKLQGKLKEDLADSHFFIRINGYFDGLESELKYNLVYSVDFSNRVIKLNYLIVDLNNRRICYPLKEKFDLPPSIDVWHHIAKAENVDIIYPKEQIKLLLLEQNEFLKSIGFYKTFLDNKSIFVDRELKKILEAHLHEFEPKNFPINVHLHLNPVDSIDCRFNYVFDPIKIKLILQGIIVESDLSMKEYSIEKIKNEKLNLQKISEDLKQQILILKARKISEGPQDRSGMKAIMKHLQKRP